VSAKALSNHYSQLTAEERFRLIWAASDRGDDAERDRLRNSSPRITFSTVDFSPYVDAFTELAMVVFAELVEEAAKFRDAFDHWSDGEMFDHAVGKKRKARRKRADDVHDRCQDLFLAQGFLLKVKANGWKLFCERLGISPFGLWQYLPGFERLKRNLDAVEGTHDRPGPAFSLVGMAKWLKRIRPADKPEVNEADILTAEKCADLLEVLFRERAKWCGGS